MKKKELPKWIITFIYADKMTCKSMTGFFQLNKKIKNWRLLTRPVGKKPSWALRTKRSLILKAKFLLHSYLITATQQNFQIFTLPFLPLCYTMHNWINLVGTVTLYICKFQKMTDCLIWRPNIMSICFLLQDFETPNCWESLWKKRENKFFFRKTLGEKKFLSREKRGRSLF